MLFISLFLFLKLTHIQNQKSFIANTLCTLKEFVLVLEASSTESTNIVQTSYTI